MKNKLLGLMLFTTLNSLLLAQGTGTAPSATVPLNLPAVANRSEFAWYRGGNNLGGAAAGNNIFGTMWDSPIYTYTFGVVRSKYNGNATYPVNGYTQTRRGYLLLGNDGNLLSNGFPLYSSKGAFSLLHVNGEGDFVQELGFRPWMRTGVTFTGNNDLSYFGLRQVGTSYDNTETVIAWSDNNSSVTDEMSFRFIGAQVGGTMNIENTTLSADDLDGLHVARYHANGRYGLGSTFGNTDIANPAGYISPQSLFHMSYQHRAGIDFEAYGFMQITMRNPFILGGGETAFDGLRFGIDNDISNAGLGGMQHFNGYLRWQEASSFIIQTDPDNTAGGVENGERFRVTSIGALRLNQGLAYGGNTNLIDLNNTRIAISHDGSLPITQPMSLLHLGYNTGGALSQNVNQGNVVGWRNWMELGMFISNRKNHVFLGLMPENGNFVNNVDHMDAVLAWGDKSKKTNAQTPDVFRFVFSGDSLDNNENASSKSKIGSEMMRIYPGIDSIYSYQGLTPSYAGLDTIYGRVGIGNFATNGVNEQPTQKLDVIGNGRFRFLPDSLFRADGNVEKIVMVDSNGVLRWKSGLSPEFANCADPDTTIGRLTHDSKINLNNHDFHFSDNFGVYNPDSNRVAVGFHCGDFLPAKFNAKLDRTVMEKSTVAYFQNNDRANALSTPNTTFYGIQSVLVRQQTLMNQVIHVGMRTDVSGARANIGNQTYASGGSKSSGAYYKVQDASNNFGIEAYTFGGSISIGIFSVVNNALKNIAVKGNAGSIISPLQNGYYGGVFTGNGTSGINYGVFTQASGTGSYALYASGNLHYTGAITSGSDVQFKREIQNERNALETIGKIKARTYRMKTDEYPQFSFDDHVNHGVIAQELEEVLPELVYESTHPGFADSLGNDSISAISYKSVNYTGLISIIIQAMNELNMKLEKQSLSDQSLKTNVNSLDGTESLNKLLALRGVSYQWDYQNHPEFDFDSTENIGLIAQEVNAVDPRLTYIDEMGLMHVKYDKLAPIIIEAITVEHQTNTKQDSVIQVLNSTIASQQAKIDSLENSVANMSAEFNELKACLLNMFPNMCEVNQGMIQNNSIQQQNQIKSALEVTLSNRNSVILSQNVPNPFAESTVIEYNIPATVKHAQIQFYDMQGKLIQTVDIAERGKGSINVFANDLSSGIYTYSLVADGKTEATKKMMKK